MKKFLFTVLFLLLIVLGGLAFFIIRSFNTENFQKQIVQSVSELTGREFTIMGATYVTWFPSPKIVLNDVTLSNTKGNPRAVMMRANRIGIQLEWQSLLKSPLVINKIDVENPVLFLERADATQVNWDFPFLSANDNKLESDILNPIQSFNQTRVENMQIRGGSIEYSNAITGVKLPLSNINGNLTMDSLKGPYQFNGSFQAEKNNFTTKVQVKRLRMDSPVPFSLNLEGDKNAFILDMNGELIPDDKKNMNVVANGSFTVQRPNDILQFFHFKPLNAALNIPSLGSMTYESAKGSDNLKSFTIRFGDNEDAVAITGSFTREERNKKLFYNGALAINTFDYSQWADLFSDINLQQLNEQNTPDFDLKLNAQTVIYDKQTAKNVALDISKKSNRLIVQSAKAVLAGDTDMTAEGGSLSQDGKVKLSLLLTGSSKNIRDLLNPFIDTKQVKNGLLQQAKFNGNVLIGSDETELDIQSLTMDKAFISGKLKIKPLEKRPVIESTLSLKNINLDDYTGYQKPKQAAELGKSISLIKTYLQNAHFLNRFNGSFDIDLTDITFHQLPIGKGKLTGTLNENTLKIKELKTTEMATASLSCSGEFVGVSQDNLKINDLKIDFQAKQLKLFLERANLTTSNEFLKKTGEIKTTLQVSEDKNIWNAVMQNTVGDLEARFAGKINTQTDLPTYEDLQVSITYPSFQRFMKTVVGTNSMNNSLEGPLSLKGTINGLAKNFKISNGNIQIGTQQLTADATVELSESKKAFTLNVLTPSFDADKYILNEFKNLTATGPSANYAFNFSVLDMWQAKIKVVTNQLLYRSLELKNAILDLSVQNRILTLNDLSGTQGINNTPFKATGSLSWANIPEIKGSIQSTNNSLNPNILSGNKMSFGGGNVTLNVDFAAKGKTPNEMKSDLNGKGTISITNSTWVGTDLTKVTALVEKTIKNRDPKTTFDTALNRLLNSGKTSIDTLSGPFTIDKGTVKMMDISMKASGLYSNPMQVMLNIPTQTVDISVPISLEAYPDLPPFALSLKGKSDALVYQPNFVDLSNSVTDLVEKSNTKVAKEVQKEEEQKEKVTLTERQEKIKQAIEQARESIKTADEKLFAGDNKPAAFLLQNAKDALSIVNNLSVKETLTDAQYIQLMEQSRLAVLKANEAIDEAIRDKYFEDRKQLATFAKQSKEMLHEIARIHETNPDIEIVTKLIPAVEKYTQTLEEAAQKASVNSTDEEHMTLMDDARSMFKKVVKAYEYVSRFDIESMGTKIVPVSADAIQNKSSDTPDDEAFVAADTGVNPFESEKQIETTQKEISIETNENSSAESPDPSQVTPAIRGTIKRLRR